MDDVHNALALLFALIYVTTIITNPIVVVDAAKSTSSSSSSSSSSSLSSSSAASLALSSQKLNQPLLTTTTITGAAAASALVPSQSLSSSSSSVVTAVASASTLVHHNYNDNGECKLSEWKCANGTCISMSKFCDGHIDCIDKSDETIHCNACNRTFYGETGKTYELEIHKPKVFPFVCHLNFTAPGGIYGDIIQINVDKFDIGRFMSHTIDGCPDGYMSIVEQDFPSQMGGFWCGSASGYNVYYSESSSINVSLHIYKLFQHLGGPDNFSFKLTYKFLKKTDAKLRNEEGIWTGDHVPGTYCNKNLYNCDRRVCRIRSPNFPGMYPRNLTCRYHIHHQPPPTGEHAMLVIRQPIGQKMYLKDRDRETNSRSLRIWNQCDSMQDYLSIYDGRTSSYPELARVCGGDFLPDIISSGSDMLIEFKTSPYDSLFHPEPISFLLGFEMQIKVLFVNANSHSYTKQSNHCEFTLSAFESASGELESPKHTLPPKTVCRYHFQGRRHEIVWISFIKYHSAVDQTVFEAPAECSPQLRIWDGKLQMANKIVSLMENQRNASLMAEICREEVPRLCSRSLISKDTRPCSSQESYLSTSPDLTVEYIPNPTGTTRLYGPGSGFKLRYEFVDTLLGGAPLQPYPGPKSMPEPAALVQVQTKSCDRVYRSNTASRGIFRSPANVFMFGRGGSTNLSCTIRFEANHLETVRLTITRARFGGRPCENIQNRSGRFHCNPTASGPISELRIGEVPWPDIPPLPRDCLCTDVSGSLILSPMAAGTVEAKFTTLEMDIDQDYRDFYFEGRYEFVKEPCHTNWDERRLKGKYGEAILGPTTCPTEIQPWLLETETENGYLVLMLKGFWMPPLLQSVAPCPTDARITVYSTNNPKQSRDLCPSGPDVVAYSDGWNSINEFSPIEISKNLVIEFRSQWRPGVEPFEYKFSWMEIFPDIDCPQKCTDLQACIAPSLWCDGKINCPSGQDEDPIVCDITPPWSPLHVGLAAAMLTILLSLAAGLAACARRKRVEKKHFHNLHHSSGGLVGGGISGGGGGGGGSSSAGSLGRGGGGGGGSSGNSSGSGGGILGRTNSNGSIDSNGYGQHPQYHHHHLHNHNHHYQQQQQQLHHHHHQSTMPPPQQQQHHHHHHSLPPLYLDAQHKDSFC